MKKIFITVFMLVGLSAVSFAEENDTDLEKNNKKEAPKSVTIQREGEVSCMAGMTTCGKTYMGCFPDGPQEVQDEEVTIIMDLAEQELCGGSN